MSKVKKPGIIVPAPGMALRCRNGHTNSWDVRIIATADGQKAKVTAVRCAVCGLTWKIGSEVYKGKLEHNILEGTGKRTNLVSGTTLSIKPGEENDGRSEYKN